MPITFECPHCSMQVRAPDVLAGKTARCPYCETNCNVPEEPPVAEVVPEPDGPIDVEPLPLDSGDPPGRSARKPGPKPEPGPWDRGEFDPARRAALRSATGKWRAFGDGCGVAQWGVWIEFGGVCLLFALLEALLLAAHNVFKLPRVVESGGVLLAVYLPLALGTLMLAIGRVMMIRMPPDTAGVSVLVVAAGMTWLRFVLLVLATLLLILGLNEVKVAREPYFDWTMRLSVAAPPAPAQGLTPMKRLALLTLVLAVLFGLQAGYTYLHYALYSAGQGAGQTDGDRES
jgi:hypothetical protein